MVSGKCTDVNLERAACLIKKAVEKGAGLIVLPETFAVFSSSQQVAMGCLESTSDGPLRRFLSEQARQFKVWIVGGTIPITPVQADGSFNPKAYTASLLINDKGEEVARYNKIHLFDVDVADQQGSYRESDTFLPGSDVVVVDTPFGRLGLAVCYDIRFPEFFRAMFAQDVDLIAIPAAFTRATGEAHWLPLLRARAIENQCYIIGANQGGVHGRRETSGGSVIINGWGEVLSEAKRGEACLVADVDLKTLMEIRKSMPVKQHQRFKFSGIA